MMKKEEANSSLMVRQKFLIARNKLKIYLVKYFYQQTTIRLTKTHLDKFSLCADERL